MEIIEQWLANKILHKEIGDYLTQELNLKKIAIYGAGKYGELLYDDLIENSNIIISYFIDLNADSLYYGIDDMDILNLEELKRASHVDAIVVTPYQKFNHISHDLKSILNYDVPLIPLDDIVLKME